MTKYSSKELDSVYHALANTTRRKILTRLAKEGRTPVTELAKPFDMSLAAISKHIKVLEKAGMLQKAREGTTLWCTAQFEPVQSAAALIHYFESFVNQSSAGIAQAQAAEAPVETSEKVFENA